MAQSDVTIPSWFKWGVGIVAVAAVVVGGPLLVKEFASLDDPSKTYDKKRRVPVGIVIRVDQGDEGDDDWYVSTTLYEGIDEQGHEYNGYGGASLAFSDKEDAVRKARELGKEARAGGQFKLVRVIATDNDRKAEYLRRRAAKDGNPASPSRSRKRPARKKKAAA